MLDLEKVAERSAIDRSYDLRLALKTSRVRLCSQGITSGKSRPEIKIVEVEKIIEKHHHETSIDEDKLTALMRKIISEQNNSPVIAEQPKDNSGQILDAMAALQEQISNIKVTGIAGSEDDSISMSSIDPVKLAEMQAKAIDKMAGNIETGNKKQSKRVVLKNTNLNNLADELD